MRALAAALLLAAMTGLAGCSSVIDHVPTWAGGYSDAVPDRPATPSAYPAVHDMPPARNDAVLSEADRKKLKDDLNATRSRTETNIQAAETTGAATPAPAGTPPKP